MAQLFDQEGNPVYVQRPAPRMDWGTRLALGAVLIMVVIILATFLGIDPRPLVQQVAPIIPTAAVAPAPAARPFQAPALPRPAVQPAEAAPPLVPGVYDSPAQADAAYQEAIQQAELNAASLPNGSKATNEAPPNAPAYDPTVPEIKYEGVPRPLEGQCLHGQVFTERGCKNPGNSSKDGK